MSARSAWNQLRQEMNQKRVLVFGLGLQGGGAETANTLHRAGAVVRVTDQKSEAELEDSIRRLAFAIEGSFGTHAEADVDWAQIIVKNPAVPYSHPLIQKAIRAGKPVVSETALALQFARDQAIGITGTRGKTTTTHLIHALIQASGKKAHLCGNIPQKPALAVLEHLHDSDWLVIEISSFHLESCNQIGISPKYAVITNVYPDHLNRYESEEEYAKTKAFLFRWQQPGDHAFYGTHHAWAETLAMAIQRGVSKHLLSTHDFAAVRQKIQTKLPGEHNQENIAFALAVANVFDIPHALQQETIAQFAGVAYRLETVAVKNGITFINDTTSTTPTALEKALDALDGPFVLIAGGTTKHLPFSNSLIKKLNDRPVFTVWLSGSGTTEIFSQLDSEKNEQATNLNDAVALAYTLATTQRIPTLVFSPGFSSFELFKNEFDRGDQFNRIVAELPEIEV